MTAAPKASARALAEIALIEIDRVTAEVVKALAAAGIQSILLKGPSVRELLYTPAELRPYGDTDLLLPPTQIELAARMLRERGFQKVTTSIGSGRKVHHDVLTRDGKTVELHRTVFGITVDDEDAWTVLEQERRPQPLPIGGTAVDVLNAPATALVLTLHAAAHGALAKQPRQDLDRALERLGMSEWQRAAALAERLGATGPMVAALELVPAGQALIERLGLPRTRSAEAELRVGAPPPTAVGFAHLAQVPGVVPKLNLLIREFFPDLAYMRDYHGLQEGNRLALVAAYAQRIRFVLRHGPRGFLAWRRAARRARER